MTWGGNFATYPRAILHIDGDSFFAACEVAKDPLLRGKVVVTGRERGIVSACTYEGKRMGITRGMRFFEVKKICPEAVILPSDYETYSLFSKRMYEVVRRYTPEVEEYGIDECFADITGLRALHHGSYEDIALKIKKELESELGITFSLGLSCTKTLAKIGSKWKKPSGFTPIPMRDSKDFLAKTPTLSVWGIGGQTSELLRKQGIHTAQDFVEKSESWIQEHLAKPYEETWRELRGEYMLPLVGEARESYASIQKTKTFTPPTSDSHRIFSELSKNVENACIKARRWNLVTKRIHFFLKTQDFRFHSAEILLPHTTSVPHEVLKAIEKHFMRVWQKGVLYRTTGITLMELRGEGSEQLDMFGAVEESIKMREAFKSVDKVSARYGKHTLFLGSSAKARSMRTHENERGDTPARKTVLFKGESARKRLAIPMLGEVS